MGDDFVELLTFGCDLFHEAEVFSELHENYVGVKGLGCERRWAGAGVDWGGTGMRE